ncbi:Glycosyltransferase [Ignavibacterium album JCM 16511]|uniref:Glycosyltransferase n=1 Tax=Ignavibacterium album (strain DSM 19864 / JCM 16511 / NBRC 101810 / Mat9-16) TaxID=945713 RepID=I0AMG2_IGNAJ|nr:glycosyltransferase family 2 protein [Ignavibacterium album]AFH50169.1 Glycosyltransferase [Ignavibacterium album JCM 16511]
MSENTILKRELISICIATYNREKLLKKLLISLINQKTEDRFGYEIVIVDNNPLGSARSVVAEFIENSKITIKYFIQPIKNISITRNLCLHNASGNYIAFIDDDEIADENWLINLYRCIINFNADGAFGYVIPIFEETIPHYIRFREYYFSPLEDTGNIARFYYTTNAILKTELLKSNSIYFDTRYGLTGGEDVHFFERLKRIGAKFITCKEAITREFISKERANENYLYIRALRGGQSYLRRKLEFNPSIVNKIIELIKTIIQFTIFVIYLVISYLIGKKSLKALIKIGDSVGKIRAIFSKYRNIY